MTAWVALFMGGWFLIFSASPGAVVDSEGVPADSWARLYFTAFTVSTLGIGDYRPSGAVFQVLTGVAAMMAFGLATLVITYVASLNSAVASRRRFARQVLGLGDSPVNILHANWTGRDFGPLGNELQSLTGTVHGLVEEQLTYPLLHYFSTRQRNAAFWPAIATLNEVVLLLDNYVRHEYRPAPLALHPLKRAIDGYLEVLPRAPVDHPMSPPPQPDVGELEAVGIEVVPGTKPSYGDMLRRNTIHAALERQGWNWGTAVYARLPAADGQQTVA
ncbi:MAG: ion channel [Actinomycetota bacterium]